MARLGILGGTFNPPHLAHLVCASEAADQLALDRVVLIPVATPPHKEAVADPGPEERVALCALAVAGDHRLAVSRLEVDRGGPSYTVDTLRALHAEAPADELVFIMGGDMALSLPTWREPEGVLGLATLAVAERSGAVRQDIAERLASFLGATAGAEPARPLAAGPRPAPPSAAQLDGEDRVAFFAMPRLDVSSSDIRRRVAEGRSIRWLVPDAVAARIADRGLYRSRTASVNP